MVRHANQTARVHDRNRAYAVDKLQTKLDQALEKEDELKAEVAAYAHAAALSRWRWALERITTGGRLCRKQRPRPSGGAGAEEEEEEDGLGGLGAAAAEAAAEAEREGEQNEEDDEESEAGGQQRTRVGGKYRWLWLYRGAVAAHRSKRLAEAEKALASAEAALKCPPLRVCSDAEVGATEHRFRSRAIGFVKFHAVTKAEEEGGIIVHRRAEKLKADVRNQADVEFNRELIAGRLPASKVVAVLNELRIEGEVDDPFEAQYGPYANRFVQIDGDPANGIPEGYVLNKPRLDPRLLSRACREAGVLAPHVSILESDAASRTQALKDCLQRERAARDQAKALASSMRASLGSAAPRPCRGRDAGPGLGGAAVIQPVISALDAGQLTSVGEVAAKIYAAVAAAALKKFPGLPAKERGEKITAACGKFRGALEADANQASAPMGFRATEDALRALQEAPELDVAPTEHRVPAWATRRRHRATSSSR